MFKNEEQAEENKLQTELDVDVISKTCEDPAESLIQYAKSIENIKVELKKLRETNNSKHFLDSFYIPRKLQSKYSHYTPKKTLKTLKKPFNDELLNAIPILPHKKIIESIENSITESFPNTIVKNSSMSKLPTRIEKNRKKLKNKFIETSNNMAPKIPLLSGCISSALLKKRNENTSVYQLNIQNKQQLAQIYGATHLKMRSTKLRNASFLAPSKTQSRNTTATTHL